MKGGRKCPRARDILLKIYDLFRFCNLEYRGKRRDPVQAGNLQLEGRLSRARQVISSFRGDICTSEDGA